MLSTCYRPICFFHHSSSGICGAQSDQKFLFFMTSIASMPNATHLGNPRPPPHWTSQNAFHADSLIETPAQSLSAYGGPSRCMHILYILLLLLLQHSHAKHAPHTSYTAPMHTLYAIYRCRLCARYAWTDTNPGLPTDQRCKQDDTLTGVQACSCPGNAQAPPPPAVGPFGRLGTGATAV